MLKRIALMTAILVTAWGSSRPAPASSPRDVRASAFRPRPSSAAPLTPVSVAGVARRSVRRCAATVVVC